MVQWRNVLFVEAIYATVDRSKQYIEDQQSFKTK